VPRAAENPQNSAVSGPNCAQGRDLDFRGDCLVRDAVRSERCSSLFLRHFPVFERIIGRSGLFVAHFASARFCYPAIFSHRTPF